MLALWLQEPIVDVSTRWQSRGITVYYLSGSTFVHRIIVLALLLQETTVDVSTRRQSLIAQIHERLNMDKQWH